MKILSRVVDRFFDGLKANAVDSLLAKGKKAKMEDDAIKQKEKEKKEKEELDRILSKIPKAKL